MAGTILEPGQIEAAASKPPFLNLPPRDLFALRGQRLSKLAEGSIQLKHGNERDKLRYLLSMETLAKRERCRCRR